MDLEFRKIFAAHHNFCDNLYTHVAYIHTDAPVCACFLQKKKIYYEDKKIFN